MKAHLESSGETEEKSRGEKISSEDGSL